MTTLDTITWCVITCVDSVLIGWNVLKVRCIMNEKKYANISRKKTTPSAVDRYGKDKSLFLQNNVSCHEENGN